MKFVLFMLSVLVTVGLTACGDEPESESTALPIEAPLVATPAAALTVEPAPTSISLPVLPGTSLDHPLPAGHTLIGSNGLEIQVTGISQDGEDIVSVLIANSEPANVGFRYYLVNISIFNPSGNNPIVTNLTHFKLVGSNRYVYDTTNYSCGYNPKITDMELYGDGKFTGYICFQIPVTESNLVLIHDPDSDTEKRRYLSLDNTEGTESPIPDLGFAFSNTYQGTILQLSLEQIVVLHKVAYNEEPDEEGVVKDYVIQPSNGDNELVVIRVQVGNYVADSVEVDMETLPAELRTDSGLYKSLNTYEVGVPTDSFHEDRNKYIPFIRGSSELAKGFKLDGWLIFDIPRDSRIMSFKWQAGEQIIIGVTIPQSSTLTPNPG